MDYKEEILMLLAYNAFFHNHSFRGDYKESAARAWAYDQVDTLTSVEVNDWYNMVTTNMATLEIDRTGNIALF